MTTSTINRRLFAIAITVITIGCVKVAELQPQEDVKEVVQENLHEVVFHAGWAPETKTVLQNDGSVWWSPDDEIALFVYPDCVYEGDKYKFRLKSDCKEPSQKTNFVGMIEGGSAESTFYAIYPYDKATNNHYGFTIPSVQYAIAGGFAPGQFVSYAHSKDENLTFYNACAGLKFSVNHSGISKVVFKNRENYEPITGNAKVFMWSDFPEDPGVGAQYNGASFTLTVLPAEGKYFIPGEYYYASLMPCNASLVISYYTDDKVATKCFYDRLLERSKIAVFTEIDKDLTFEDRFDYSYATLSDPILPDDVDKNTIEEVIFHTSSDVTTETVVPGSIPRYVRMGYYDIEYVPVYFEQVGATAHYYTKADRYMMTGPHCIHFTDWAELRSVDLSMFCTNQVSDFAEMFTGCINLENVNLSSFDTSNSRSFSYMFERCNKLTRLDISNFSSKSAVFDTWWETFGGMFSGCHNLVSLDLGSFEISAKANHSMSSFAMISQNCAIRCSSVTRETLSSDLSTNSQYITWVLPGEEIPELVPYHFDYYSTDYSKDKSFKVLQSASVGNGINIILMGDGYSDRMINDGTYDEDITIAMNAIFKNEPYASFKDYFNVYEVYAVSENEIPGKSTTALRSFIGDIDPINGPTAYYEDYYLKKYAKIPDDDIDETCIVLVLNQEPSYVAGVATPGWIMEGDDVDDVTDYAKGGSVAMVCRSRLSGDEYFSFVVAHEFAHGFAKLADEYILYSGTMEDWEKDSYLRCSTNYGWWSNLDFTNNSSIIKWNRFLTDERYAGTVGIYEGATYSYGCWRPSEYSIMHNDAISASFNAPSRETIYKRIHRLAFGKEWQYDYETFVEYDQKNITADKALLSAPKSRPYQLPDIYTNTYRKIEKVVLADGRETIRITMN